ncbi:MAG: bifunctional 5,10-methylenetetrahydrofolate dehydrogenase/5,10-methenyltetrahydrofolate cyclohydrolase [Chitinophagaceae bacterium]|nr:bifunctional 5,10-methylenetetrahydrofolate dehydrogenase/5,10-methenyltetrahydrofolate cyclohydrolase [Chitinophagaceae bacterium]
MILLDGKLASQAIKNELKEKVLLLKKEGKKAPHLAAILVGNDGASDTYVTSKVKNCEEVGFTSSLYHLPDTVSEHDLVHLIKKLNVNTDIDGILVQLPLPPHIAEEKITSLVDPAKDVDGFNPVNVGNMVLRKSHGSSSFIPATPYGILLLLQHYNIETKGKHAVVIGRSNIVGKPLSILLSRNDDPGNCTVTLCHSHTKNLKEICLQADIIVAALGKPAFLKADMIKQDAVIIDVGINRITDLSKKNGYVLKGDVDFEKVAEKCSYITPVPGGVGPMTIAALLMNTFKASQALQTAVTKK